MDIRYLQGSQWPQHLVWLQGTGKLYQPVQQMCPDLQPLMNGAITYQPAGSVQLEGTHATHSCTSGYRLSGGPVRVCQSDRTWSGDTITCLAIRVAPSANDPPTPGQSYTLTCTVTGADSLNPTISYQWTRGSTTVGTNAILTFDPLVLSDTGQYRCEVTLSSNLLSENIRAVSDVFNLEITSVFIQLLFRNIHKCSEYRQTNINGVIQDITNGLTEAIQGLCGCGLTAGHISKSFVQCFSDQIAFRAQLNQTNQATTEELVSYIYQWARNSGRLIVQGSLLQLNTTCSLVITDQLVSTECPTLLTGDQPTTGAVGTLPSSAPPSSQTDNTGAIVGGVVILVLILAVTAVIIVYLVLKRRRMRRVGLKTPDIPLTDKCQSSPVEMTDSMDVIYEEMGVPHSLKGTYRYSHCEAYTPTPRGSVVNVMEIHSTPVTSK